MSIHAIIKTCPACHKNYSFNPSVGQFKCPYCYGLGKLKKESLLSVLKRKLESENEISAVFRK